LPCFSDDIEILRRSPLFEADWYLARYGDVALSGLDPAEHYLRIGAALGRDPGPMFCAQAYLAICRNKGITCANPLVHFETKGRTLGLIPGPSHPVKPDFGLARPTGVDIIVPVFNALEDTRACLTALAETAKGAIARLHILLIDDGSDSETATFLDHACTTLGHDTIRFTLTRHAQNLGYTHAINTGLAQSDAPFVITLNSDTIVTPGWIDALLRCFRSDPQIGIVGPLSNAASWQNMPALWDEAGGFAINALPDGMSPAEMAMLIRQATPRPRYPRTPFVNGFCMAIRRNVIEAIGLMDADLFGAGYGEENDYCIRAADAGFALAFAEDAYVFHAKSKSFGSTRREALSKAGHDALCDKHGEGRVQALLGEVAGQSTHGPMAHLRHCLNRLLANRGTNAPDTAAHWLLTQRILFLLPVGAGGGGGHSVMQEAAAMRALGVTVRVAVGDFAYRDFLSNYRDIPYIDTILLPCQPDDLHRIAQDFDVVVATLYSTVKDLAALAATCPQILPAYYAQDYEPLFFAPGSAERAEAEASYTLLPQMLLFAKTDWIREEIEARHGVHVAKVSPSIDHSIYFPPMRPPVAGPFRISAMIRPSTARRGAARTMAFLKQLHARHQSNIAITIFGCDPDDPAMDWLDQEFPFQNAGVITRAQVADLLRRSDLFVDLSDYQAFGRTSLEAMACGALPLVPHLGGGDEYAVDGVNALVCDTQDLETCRARVSEMIDSPGKLQRMRFAAIATASEFSARRAAMSELLMLAKALALHRQDMPDQAVSEPVLPTPTHKITTTRGPAPAFAAPIGGDPLASGALSLPSGPATTCPKLNIGVHLHVHYPDLAAEIATHLAHIPVPFQLYVSTPAEHAAEVRRALASLSKVRLNIQSFPNKGRDIAPFLAGFGSDLRQHDLICHIHTKASPHNAAKADWRSQLLNALLGSPASIAAIFQLFEQTPHLGLVFPEYHAALADQISWGTNFAAAKALADRMRVPLDPNAVVPFPAGSMFWARSAALEPLLALNLGFEDFPQESGQIDGTPAHAIERLFGEITLASGHSLLQIQRRGDDATA